jgi:hypothetical protein
MDMRKKLIRLPFLLIVGCLLAANYGALHNQISYTVSPYFYLSHGLYADFQIPMEYWGRTGAAMVGVLGTWWMGLVIGVPLLTMGLIVLDSKAFVKQSLIAFSVVFGTTFVLSMLTLFIATITHSNPDVNASMMHEYGYYCGVAGFLVGCVYLVVVKRKSLK